jgi:hypothetical protein
MDWVFLSASSRHLNGANAASLKEIPSEPLIKQIWKGLYGVNPDKKSRQTRRASAGSRSLFGSTDFWFSGWVSSLASFRGGPPRP